ncbi:MAG TPA: tetratricopeptide repeat protein [Pirellulales bacterium]
MTAQKKRGQRWRPIRWIRRLVMFVAFDLLHAVNLAGDGIAPPADEPAAANRPRRRQRPWRVLTVPIIAALMATGRLLSYLAAQFELRSISMRFHAFLDNWGLLDDAIDGRGGLRRRLLSAVRFPVSVVVRLVPWLRVGAFLLLSELLYHLGLINDSVDVRRVWTRKMTLSVLPAVLGAIVAIGLGAGITLTSRDDLSVRYGTAAKQAIDDRDHARAALWLTRLAKQEPRQPAYRYELAVALDGEGQHEQARALMQTLAPSDRAGFPPAHLWLARRLCEQPSATIGELQAAWRHLNRVLHYSPHAEEVHALLARVLVSLGQLADAEQHLKQAATHDPDMRLLLAAVYAREGKFEQSEQSAKAADQILSQQLDDQATEPQRLRLRLADAKVLAGDFAGAQRVLSQLELDDPAAAQMRLAQLYLAWYDALGRAGGSPVERCALLQRSWDAVPWNLPALERLLQLADKTADESQWSAGVLEKMDWSTAPVQAHVAVGLAQWQAGEHAAARQHLEAACRAAPQDVRAGNNLAWMLAHDDPPELERALELSSQALAQAPRQSNLLDTHGRILFKLGRWSEALRDFEALAAARPQDTQLHELLADCYAKLDMPELADFQRRLATNAKPTSDSQPSADPPSEQ